MINNDNELDTTRRDAPLRISARGRAVLANPMTNRGTAFCCSAVKSPSRSSTSAGGTDTTTVPVFWLKRISTV